MTTTQLPMFAAEHLIAGRGEGALDRIRQEALACRRCSLATSRTQVVFGEGKSWRPTLAIVGEVPGRYEDQKGKPFIGKAGELLDKMLKAMRLKREQLYVLNTVCCRPPDNRDPEPTELKACRPFLRGQLRAVQPMAILAMGEVAAKELLETKKSTEALRGLWFKWDGEVPLRVTYHPAYLLRNPAKKPAVWEDLQAVMTRLGIARS